MRIREEIVADRHGRLRMAGTIDPNGYYIEKVRYLCTRSLFAFCLVVLGRTYLTKSLHLPVANWLQTTPGYRKLLLLPRRHAKTSVVSHGLPLHLVVQPEDGPYMPWKAGCDLRILMSGETETRACDNLRVVRNVLESNELFRGLWPELVWENPRKQASKWNETNLVLPRNENYPDPTFRANGVGGAITGARLDCMIKDDLISEAASNSEVVMETAIRWHTNTRALFDDQDKSLEYVIGTKWAVRDLYAHIMETDPTVDTMVRSIVENGRPIYPEAFTMETVDRLRKEFGIMFPLMYMNSVGDPDLVDFVESMLRFYTLVDEQTLEFDPDMRDGKLEEKYNPANDPFPRIKRGQKLTTEMQRMMGNSFGDLVDHFYRFRS